MLESVGKGRSLLVDGPASVKVIDGQISIFGAEYGPGSGLDVHEDRRIPLTAIKGSKLELSLGSRGSFAILESDPIPDSWREAVEQIIDSGMSRIMIIGMVDSGKSSFSLFLANSATQLGKTVALIDADIGQSDVGPPGTVGLVLMNEPRLSISSIEPAGMSFVGAKSPSKAILPLVRSFKRMRRGALRSHPNLVIINTDGWVTGDLGVYLKVLTAEIYEIDAAVLVSKDDELKDLINALSEVKIIKVGSPSTVRERDREARRRAREMRYARFLRGGTDRTFPIDIVRGLSNEDDWKGLMVGMEAERGRLLGIGIIKKVDRLNKQIVVNSPVDKEIKAIQVGKIRLFEDGTEMEDE